MLNRSDIGTWIPHLASTAWISALQCERSPTSLARCRTSSRSSRVAGGAIHASGSRPIRSRSARSVASRTSFLTRRYSNAFTPSGCARCTRAPSCLEGVHGPVPAVGRLEHHLGVLTGACHHAVEPVDVVEDLGGLQHLTGLGGPDNHTPAAMQIDTDELLACVLCHQGPPSSC